MCKIKINTICCNDKLHTNCQKTDNSFLCVFINNFVKKLGNYNTDEFLITISGLKSFIQNDE